MMNATDAKLNALQQELNVLQQKMELVPEGSIEAVLISQHVAKVQLQIDDLQST